MLARRPQLRQNPKRPPHEYKHHARALTDRALLASSSWHNICDHGRHFNKSQSSRAAMQ